MHITIILTLIAATITTTSGLILMKPQPAEDFDIHDGHHEGNGISCKYFNKAGVWLKNCTKSVFKTNVPINQKFDGTESWTDYDCESKAKFDRRLETAGIVMLVLVSFAWICMMCVINQNKKLEGEEGHESPEPAVNLEEIEPEISSDLPPPSYQQATVFGNQTQS